jgi:hypothetical protein
MHRQKKHIITDKNHQQYSQTKEIHKAKHYEGLKICPIIKIPAVSVQLINNPRQNEIQKMQVNLHH